MVTASVLYNLVECPQRVALDSFGDLTQRDDISAFVRLLWERGTLFEQETIAGLRLPFLDLSGSNDVDRERLTLEAMNKGEPLIYGGCIATQEKSVDAARQSSAIRDRKTLSEFELPEPPANFAAVLGTMIDGIAKDAEKRLADHVAAHGMVDGGERWIAEGLKHADNTRVSMARSWSPRSRRSSVNGTKRSWPT